MTIEIRACRDKDELEQYNNVVAYVFAENSIEDMATENAQTLPEWTTAAFDDGRCIATMGTFPFTADSK